ncbi:hypothetical protein SAMN05661096_03929 [Marivirga sericea]|uniref:Outer membrane protein beta-barrel domain-containing protein n=1 Tax=Marivirga sericea TaxID=1028 RepID=A0A1X7LFA2_9BACT|nr:hypothetical protein [Marivirga sericea]SMG52455.1 hypothetical protein SAMN05661096_03929 [Marivirga sericea]
MKTQQIILIIILAFISVTGFAQEINETTDESVGFYFQPEYSAMFLNNHIGNAVGFGLGISSKNRKWDIGIRYYGRSGPINLQDDYELVLPAGETYKGSSTITLGADHGYLGLEAAYTIILKNERLAIRIPLSFGQLGAGFYLRGEDRFTPDGERTSVWEDRLQGGSDAGFGLCSEFGAQFLYQLSSKNDHIQLMLGAAYINTYGYESFLGGNDFYNNKVRVSAGFRFSF